LILSPLGYINETTTSNQVSMHFPNIDYSLTPQVFWLF